MPIKRIALAQKVTRKTVWEIRKKFEKYGKEGLKNHKPGRIFEPLNPKFYNLVVQEWRKTKYGARKLHEHFKRKAFGVSRRKIEQVLIVEGFQKSVPKRKKPRKYKRYEWPISNYMWHTDWHVIKAEKLKGENIIVYLEDSSRRIMGYCTGAETTRNSLFALYSAISKQGVMPYILNSDRGSQFFPNKKDKKGKAVHKFQEVLKELGIKFVASRRRHPQTNGKLEKFFHILDREFDERFETLEDYMNWYNNERLSEAVDYMTPNEAYKNRL